MTSLSRPRVEFISTILQTVLNLGLLCLGLILVVFLGKETVHLADVLFAPEQTSKYELVEGLVVYFLYYSAAIFLIPICISFDTAEKRRYATYLILNRRFSFEF